MARSEGHSVRQVIDVARAVTGHKIPAVPAERRTGDPAVPVADSGKIRKELDWKPRFESLRTIIETAWVWHSKESRRKKPPRKARYGEVYV